jgi:hypothetical protein
MEPAAPKSSGDAMAAELATMNFLRVSFEDVFLMLPPFGMIVFIDASN